MKNKTKGKFMSASNSNKNYASYESPTRLRSNDFALTDSYPNFTTDVTKGEHQFNDSGLSCKESFNKLIADMRSVNKDFLGQDLCENVYDFVVDNLNNMTNILRKEYLTDNHLSTYEELACLREEYTKSSKCNNNKNISGNVSTRKNGNTINGNIKSKTSSKNSKSSTPKNSSESKIINSVTLNNQEEKKNCQNYIFSNNYVKFTDLQKQEILGEINENWKKRKENINGLLEKMKESLFGIMTDIKDEYDYEQEEFQKEVLNNFNKGICVDNDLLPAGIENNSINISKDILPNSKIKQENLISSVEIKNESSQPSMKPPSLKNKNKMSKKEINKINLADENDVKNDSANNMDINSAKAIDLNFKLEPNTTPSKSNMFLDRRRNLDRLERLRSNTSNKVQSQNASVIKEEDKESPLESNTITPKNRESSNKIVNGNNSMNKNYSSKKISTFNKEAANSSSTDNKSQLAPEIENIKSGGKNHASYYSANKTLLGQMKTWTLNKTPMVNQTYEKSTIVVEDLFKNKRKKKNIDKSKNNSMANVNSIYNMQREKSSSKSNNITQENVRKRLDSLGERFNTYSSSVVENDSHRTIPLQQNNTNKIINNNTIYFKLPNNSDIANIQMDYINRKKVDTITSSGNFFLNSKGNANSSSSIMPFSNSPTNVKNKIKNHLKSALKQEKVKNKNLKMSIANSNKLHSPLSSLRDRTSTNEYNTLSLKENKMESQVVNVEYASLYPNTNQAILTNPISISNYKKMLKEGEKPKDGISDKVSIRLNDYSCCTVNEEGYVFELPEENTYQSNDIDAKEISKYRSYSTKKTSLKMEQNDSYADKMNSNRSKDGKCMTCGTKCVIY